MRKRRTQEQKTQAEHYQAIWHEYEKESGTKINDPEVVARWAIETGRVDVLPPSQLTMCKKALTRALRYEYITDA